jgi:predicted PolB exonuclease-like 3'-5' exonuclease
MRAFGDLSMDADDALDLCDVLSSYNSQGKVKLHEVCRVMGLPGKPDGIRGEDVDRYYREGRIREITDYCESDVVNTCGALTGWGLDDHDLGLKAHRNS